MKRLGVLLLVFLTTGCTHLNHQFDCPPEKGVGCKRLSAINEEYNKKHGIKTSTSRSATYIKTDQYDVYFEGYEEAPGVYHHPRKVTVKV